MRILFDHGTPAPLIPFLESHTVTKAKDAGWDRISNGALLTAAEAEGFGLVLTTDQKNPVPTEFDGSKNRDRSAREFDVAGGSSVR